MLHISLIDIDHNHLATRCLNYIDSPLPRCQLSRTGTLCAAGSKHLQIRFTSITRTTQTIIRMFITWVLKTCLIEKNTHHFLKPKFRRLQDDSKNASPSPQKLGPFFSLFLMRKTLSSGQKWFLMPYFPLIRDMLVFRSGLRFSFRALEVPELRVRKRPLLPTN